MRVDSADVRRQRERKGRSDALRVHRGGARTRWRRASAARSLEDHRRRPERSRAGGGAHRRAVPVHDRQHRLRRSAGCTTSSCSRDDGRLHLPIALRFRFLGAVNARYATVDPQLSIRSGARSAVSRLLRAARDVPQGVRAVQREEGFDLRALSRSDRQASAAGHRRTRRSSTSTSSTRRSTIRRSRQARHHRRVRRKAKLTGSRDNVAVAALSMTGFRCELLSADQLAALASGPLPRGHRRRAKRVGRCIAISTSTPPTTRCGGAASSVACAPTRRAARRSRCASPAASASGGDSASTRAVAARDVRAVLAADNAVVRRLRGVVDPARARGARRSRGRSPHAARVARLAPPPAARASISIASPFGATERRSASFFQMCAHQLRGDDAELLASRARARGGARRARSRVGARERAELAIKWARLDDTPRGRGGTRIACIARRCRYAAPTRRRRSSSTPS